MVLNGIDDAASIERELRGRRLGLVTNHTGLARDLTPTALVLRRIPGANLVRLFAPEHGIWGEAQAGVAIPNTVDPLTGHG